MARSLHTVRDKDDHEIDFVLMLDDQVTHRIEVKTSHVTPSAYLHRMAAQFAQARPVQAVQIVHQLRQESEQGSVAVRPAGAWLAELAA